MVKFAVDLSARPAVLLASCEWLLACSSNFPALRLDFNSDLKGMAKIASAILLLRKGGSTDWTSTLDTAFVAWCRQYITWLETSPIALEEASAEK